MQDLLKKRLKRIAMLSAVAACIGGLFAMAELQNRNADGTQSADSMAVPGVKIGGPFALTDHTGRAVTEKDYAGKYKLIYFGFTFCPAICPTELQKMAQTFKILGPDGDAVQPLFVTLDPERDTVPVMADYVKMFDPRLTGLTGTPQQIEAVKQSYRVFSRKVQDEGMSDYTVDHSSFIYLMSPQDDLISIYRAKDDAAYVAGDIKQRLSRVPE